MGNLNLNKVILGGRLTADPELRTTPSNISVVTFTVAVNRRTAKDEERQADFISCKAWRGTAEFVARFFHKGESICVIGSLQCRKWQDKDGRPREAWEVVADEVMFVDSKTQDQGFVAHGGYPEPPRADEEYADNEDLPF